MTADTIGTTLAQTLIMDLEDLRPGPFRALGMSGLVHLQLARYARLAGRLTLARYHFELAQSAVASMDRLSVGLSPVPRAA